MSPKQDGGPVNALPKAYVEVDGKVGAALVQFDELVLTEVVFTEHLLNEVVNGLPRERLGLHMCRGNWTRDESAALCGDYRPLLGLLKAVNVGTLFLELCTHRAGEMEVLKDLPDDKRLGVGVVNQKLDRVESVEEITAKAARAVQLFGRERVLLVTDCGFATFADKPVASA